MVENYGHISRCDNIGMCACGCNIYTRFEKIFNDNRAHIRIYVREKKEGIKKGEDEEEGGMMVQYRVYAEGGMYALSLVGRMNE